MNKMENRDKVEAKSIERIEPLGQANDCIVKL